MKNKENISEYAKRMRELTGFNEGSIKKTIKTIQEGNSSFEDGPTFFAKDMTGVVNKEEADELDKSVNKYEEKKEFETHKINQKKIEEGENDEELYSLNENTIIVLDFLDENKNN